jgi:hypothetical protein
MTNGQGVLLSPTELSWLPDRGKKTWLVIKHGDGKSGKSIVLAFPNQASHNAQQAKQYCLDWFPEDNFFVLNPVLSSWSLNTIYTASPFFM